MERTYTVEEVAAILRVSTDTVRREIKLGRLRAFRVGRQFRIKESALREFMDNQGRPDADT